MKRVILVALVFALLLSFSFAYAEKKEFSKAEIKDIAIRTVKAKGYDLEEAEIIYDSGNKMWTRKIGYLTQKIDDRNHGVLVQGFQKNYRTVYFDLKEPANDLWVFVDKDTGEVLAVISD